ncbi:MAG: mevalonate kinase [Polyangiaceae bacterium]|nr:mevalonate kinase [Polyangiaceae bacterium]
MARSNGKVILLGEHAVVYGVPAIAAGIGIGATAIAEPIQKTAPATIRVGESTAVADDGSELAAALAALLGALGSPPVALHVDLELPPGCGLGASAAIAVAAARAVLELGEGTPGDPEPRATTDRVLHAANAWERVYHGNPSGIDAAASAHGGVLFFRRGERCVGIPISAPLRIAIAIAGPPASTRAMVESVAELKQRRPETVDRTLGAIDALVRNARRHLEGNHQVELGRLLDLNHTLLSTLMLSTAQIERVVALARGAGALGAKLTGSGGGGAVIALVEDPAPVLAVWREAGFRCFATAVQPSLSGPG